MRVQILCPDCRSAHPDSRSAHFEVMLIDGERMVLHCVTCSRERHVKTTPVKLEVN